MRKVVCILLMLVAVIWPSPVLAAGFTLNLHVVRQEDGTTCGELWYNQKVIWRLALLAGGAKPVSGSYHTVTTLIAPDIINGLFVIKVQ